MVSSCKTLLANPNARLFMLSVTHHRLQKKSLTKVSARVIMAPMPCNRSTTYHKRSTDSFCFEDVRDASSNFASITRAKTETRVRRSRVCRRPRDSVECDSCRSCCAQNVAGIGHRSRNGLLSGRGDERLSLVSHRTSGERLVSCRNVSHDRSDRQPWPYAGASLAIGGAARCAA